MKPSKNMRNKKNIRSRRSPWIIIGGIILGALIVVTGLIMLSAPPSGGTAIVSAAPITWPNPVGKSLGPADAKVVLTEFADFQCPYCRQFEENVLPKVIAQYVATGKVRYEYKHFIVIDRGTGGNESRQAAEASECASEQGRFWDYSATLFANQGAEGSGALSDNRLKAFAENLKLDTARFNACLDSSKYAAQVVQDERLASSLKLTGTPTLLVNNVPISNAFDLATIQKAVDAALKQAGQ